MSDALLPFVLSVSSGSHSKNDVLMPVVSPLFRTCFLLYSALFCMPSLYRSRLNISASPPPHSLYLPDPSSNRLPLHYTASTYYPPSSPPFSPASFFEASLKPHPIFHSYVFPPPSPSMLGRPDKSIQQPGRGSPPRRKHSRKWSTGREYLTLDLEILEEGEDGESIVDMVPKLACEKRSFNWGPAAGIGKRSISS